MRARVRDRPEDILSAGTFSGITFPEAPEAGRVSLALSLADARDKARDWKRLLGQGQDPTREEEKRRRAELRKQSHLFEAVAEEYFAGH